MQRQPAPIDVDLVTRTTTEFARARTLPAAAYLSEELFGWENEHFFRSSWVCCGRSADVEAPGSQKAVSIGGLGILVVRGEDGFLGAFHNTCRHRGHELLECGETNSAGVIRCPYHRWTYDLDGTFKGGPGMASQPHFDSTDPENSLLKVRVVEWHGWLFVNASGDAPDFMRHVGNLDGVVAPYRAASLTLGSRHSYEIAANWKIVVENYQECYHCSEIHPELCKVSSPTSGKGMEPTGLWVGGTMELLDGVETMSLSGRSSGVRIEGLSDDAARTVGYFWLFPNLLISTHPDYVMTHRIEPLAADETRVECEWLFPGEAIQHPDFDPSYASEFWDITNLQDWRACESVQRGVGGPGHRQAPYSAQEVQVYETDLMIARGYLTGSVTEPVQRFTEVRL